MASHIHRYVRRDIGKREWDKKNRRMIKNSYIVYMCRKPGCSHYLSPALLRDKVGECNRCFEPMIMTRAALKLAEPHCDNCTKKKKDIVSPAMELLKDIAADKS